MSTPASPAQRYAAFRQRSEDGAEFTAFQGLYDFAFDDFQRRACQALAGGHGVLVAAPTGSGKTVIGEFAVHLALAEGRKCFYTTPIKALSNQKYNDLARRYGTGQVGLLTGDNSINGEAPVVVMTTEVLRNMLYAGSPTLAGLAYVVLDEVHYLADRFRGAVWEEVIIHLPDSVRVVALSATVSNAEEFGDWLAQVRGGTTVIVDEHRPVPLWQHMLAGGRLYDLFIESGPGHGGRRNRPDGGQGPAGERRAQVNPELLRLARRDDWAARKAPSRPVRGGRAAGALPVTAPPGCHRPAGPRGAAPGDHVHLQPGGLRGRGPPVPGRGCPADHAGRGRRDHRDRRAAHQRHPRGGPARARLRRVAHRAAARRRRAPRRHAAHVQGSGRGTLRGGPGPRGLRHRDAGPGHQHARPDGRGGTAGQVERRDPCGPDPGGVHAAHRPGGAPGHRRGRARRRALAAGRGPAGGGRPGRHPHLPAQFQLPALLQHGGEPGRPGWPGQGGRAAGVVVRPVPGGPGGGRDRAAGPPQPGNAGGTRPGVRPR